MKMGYSPTSQKNGIRFARPTETQAVFEQQRACFEQGKQKRPGFAGA
jgi:hypothetical protein